MKPWAVRLLGKRCTPSIHPCIQNVCAVCGAGNAPCPQPSEMQTGKGRTPGKGRELNAAAKPGKVWGGFLFCFLPEWSTPYLPSSPQDEASVFSNTDFPVSTLRKFLILPNTLIFKERTTSKTHHSRYDRGLWTVNSVIFSIQHSNSSKMSNGIWIRKHRHFL